MRPRRRRLGPGQPIIRCLGTPAGHPDASPQAAAPTEVPGSEGELLLLLLRRRRRRRTVDVAGRGEGLLGRQHGLSILYSKATRSGN